MKVWKKFGLLIVAITVMTGTYLLNTTEVYAIGPNETGVPQVRDRVIIGVYGDDSKIATITNRIPFTVQPTVENGWDKPLIVYLYEYISDAEGYPYNPEKIGAIMEDIGSGWKVGTMYFDEEMVLSDFAEFSTEFIDENIMSNIIMEWDTGSDDPTPCTTGDAKGKAVVVDYDTFKSEMPSKTVIASNTLGANSFFDLKVHAADDRTKANQAFLVQNYIGANAKILLTENIYPRRDLSTTENGTLQILTWGNLPKNQAGAIKAVVYNQTDKAYVISGTLDANGTATFAGFKLRPASTITICK